MPRASSSARQRPADEATPNHNAVAAQNLIRLAVLTGDDRWREKADRLIAAIAPAAVENLYMHMALLNAVDLRLRTAEIVVAGEGPGAQALLAAARALPALDRVVLEARAPDALPQAHPARAKIAGRERSPGFRLRRREVLAAGDRCGRAHARHRQHATCLKLRAAARPFTSAPQRADAQVFIESKNSPLFLVLRSLSSRKSIASMVPIGLRMRRSTYIFLS